MSINAQDGSTINNKTNRDNHDGASEDTIPLKNAESTHDSSKDSLTKDNQTSSATIDINDQSTKVPKRNRFIGKYSITCNHFFYK